MPLDSLTIGLIQREITPDDPAGNLLATLETLKRVAEQEIDLFVLNELWATGLLNPTDQSDMNLAESIDGPTVGALRDFCREYGIHLLAGTIALKNKNGITNTALLIDPSGDIILKYSKVHLFAPMGEDQIFEPGDELAAAEVKGVGVGVVICYDLRFPGLIRSLARAGCEIILVPSMWPELRINHFEIFLRARAIENQVYMVGANGLCNMHGVFIPGHSMIVGPSGEALNSAEMRESVIVRKLDLKKLRKYRRELCYIDSEVEITDVNWTAKVNESGGQSV